MRRSGEDSRDRRYRVPSGRGELGLGGNAGAEIGGSYVSRSKVCSQKIRLAKVGVAQIRADQSGEDVHGLGRPWPR